MSRLKIGWDRIISYIRGLNMFEWLRGMNHSLNKGCQYVPVVKETNTKSFGLMLGSNPVVESFLI